MLNKSNRTVDLLVYYVIGLLLLLIFGLLYKTLFAVYNYGQFSALSFSQILYALFWGVRFDLASAALLSFIGSVVLWFSCRFTPSWQTALPVLAFMLIFQLSLQTGDAIYFAESGRHVSYEMRDVLTDMSGLFMTALTHHYFFIFLSYTLGISLAFFLLKRLRPVLSPLPESTDTNSTRPQKPGYFSAIKLVVSLLVSVVLVRGGITSLPQGVISAFKIGDAQQAIITMNGAYSIVYGAINSSKEIDRVEVKLPEGSDVDQVMRSLYPLKPGTAVAESAYKRYNLIFILMEGWPADFMSAYGYEFETTPFYTQLKEKSLAPLGVIAGGIRTTEGMFATFCSQQNPLGQTVAQSSLQNNHYDCLPSILKRQGWHTAFFQGTHKETSGTGAFAQSLGFTESFAKEDMPQGRYPHNYWGAHDPDIYDFLLARLDQMPQPFLVGVNTNSTHDVKIPDGVEAFFGVDDSLQQRQSVLRFSDQAMKEFFEKIRHKLYYKDTIFVLMSDHTHDQHKNLVTKYFIPGIVFAEDLVPAKVVNRYVSQRDFSPTILEILGFAASPSFSGKSFWSDQEDVYFADYFDSGSIGWISDDVMVETSVANPDITRCYSFEDGLLHTIQLECDKKYKTESLHSLVFTSYSQNLLFKGETENYYGFINKK
ncbi:MAG: sulfatase-like hydrolase/transferase [Gammaproteobacteria bacterium]|nr:sulfatase-like hydrolase/transferase [Gammaproteobacteria bacterium]